MQEYRKLLCVNKIRETKRLIENMLIPILSLVVAAAVVGYQIVINFFPIIWKINACNLRICYLVFGFLILYSFGVCFINVKPAIIIKPASLFFIQEKRIRQMISIKYIGLTLKDIIFSIILSACINGIHLNRNFLFILLIIFLLLNTTNLMRWKIYHANQRRDIGIWLLFSIILVISLKYFFMCIIIDIGIWMYMLVYDFGVLEINALKYEDEMQFLEKVRIAQNFNNTVLLDQYAKEKMVRYLQRKNKVSNFLYYFPLIWKAQISKLATTSSTGGLLLALQRAIVTARPKGRYRKHFCWPAIKRYYSNLLVSILLLALLYTFELLHLLYCQSFQHNIL